VLRVLRVSELVAQAEVVLHRGETGEASSVLDFATASKHGAAPHAVLKLGDGAALEGVDAERDDELGSAGSVDDRVRPVARYGVGGLDRGDPD
jgi:hypothetical protein